MSLNWPGNASGSPQTVWSRCVWIRKSGRLCLDSCLRDPTPETAVKNGWIDGYIHIYNISVYMKGPAFVQRVSLGGWSGHYIDLNTNEPLMTYGMKYIQLGGRIFAKNIELQNF